MIFEKLSNRKIAAGLFALALLKALILVLIIPPTYGSDGAGYLRYIDTFRDPTVPDALWYIRGTTPVYPFFAYTAYLFGLGSGYTITIIQILPGAAVAPAIFLALNTIDKRAALLSAILIAIDPQTGHLFQLVSTEALYIALAGLGIAAFFWNVQFQKPILAALCVGILLGVGSMVRPVGLLLILPYAFFYILITRSIKRTAALIAGYVTVFVLLSLVNLWRFDFFGINNTNGFYLATRLFGVGELYDRHNGAESERLFQLASECDVTLTGASDAETLEISQGLRLCLIYQHEMSFDEVSSLYQNVYAEATRKQPLTFARTMLEQTARYAWQSSDAYDLEGANLNVGDCTSEAALISDAWWDYPAMFCPQSPTPLSFLVNPAFLAILGFSLFTRILNFGLAIPAFLRGDSLTRWLLLFCLAVYSYYAVTTAFAGTILARYVTVTNPFMLVTLGFGAVAIYDWIQARKQPASA